MGDFHFLRPWWLLALPVGIALILRLSTQRAGAGAWRKVVEASLQPFVLSDAPVFAESRWPLVAALAAWTLATLALAGPAWQRLPVPAFRSNEALVLALDLSRSMDAADLPPSRLARARLKVLSLLDRRKGGQTGLIVFSANAFTVTPLTTDTHTISSLVSALTTDIMPSQGSDVATGLEKAATLLRQASVTEGEILLISDASVTSDAIQKARALRRAGFRVSVLGVGTAQGAPIPERNGGFLTDDAGRVVVPQLEAAGLKQLADAGGGRFAIMTADDRDLDAVVPSQETGAVERARRKDETQRADVWRDAGRWLTLLLLPLVALGFRRGWVCLWVACLLLPMAGARAQEAPGASPPAAAPQAPVSQPGTPASQPGTPASQTGALTLRAGAPEGGSGGSWKDAWQSLWKRADQRGAAALDADQPQAAARLFEDPEWRGAAQYRAGDYTGSAASLGAVDTADADYNRGNALARAGQLAGAVSAYDRALELDSRDEDARYNRDLVKRLLDQQKKQQQSQQNQQQAGRQQDAGQGANAQAGRNGQSDQNGADSGQQQARDDGSPPPNGRDPSGRQRGGQDRAADRDSEPGEDARKGDEQKGDAKKGTPRQSDENAADEQSPAPQDVEKWASEQAADQWLRRIPQDPGGLLRRKFLYQYQRLGVDQDGNYVRSGNQKKPW